MTIWAVFIFCPTALCTAGTAGSMGVSAARGAPVGGFPPTSNRFAGGGFVARASRP